MNYTKPLFFNDLEIILDELRDQINGGKAYARRDAELLLKHYNEAFQKPDLLSKGIFDVLTVVAADENTTQARIDELQRVTSALYQDMIARERGKCAASKVTRLAVV